MTNGTQFQWRWQDTGQAHSPLFDTLKEAREWQDPSLKGTYSKVTYEDGWKPVETNQSYA